MGTHKYEDVEKERNISLPIENYPLQSEFIFLISITKYELTDYNPLLKITVTCI